MIEPSIGGFWKFAYERQSIWKKRTSGELKPWTKDLTLQKYWFCNVHRELDPGTVTLIESLKNCVTSKQKLHRVMFYRVFNNRKAWNECIEGKPVYEAFDNLAKRNASGQSIFTRAWSISSLPYPGSTRLEKVRYAVGCWELESCLQQIEDGSSLEHVWQALRKQKLMGEFTAFQTALDVTYWNGRYTDDEWVYSFCSKKDFVENAKAYTAKGSGAACRWLGRSVKEIRDGQEQELEKAGLSWGEVAWLPKPRLTLADVEHTLCEYVKYVNLSNEPGKHFSRRYPGA